MALNDIKGQKSIEEEKTRFVLEKSSEANLETS